LRGLTLVVILEVDGVIAFRQAIKILDWAFVNVGTANHNFKEKECVLGTLLKFLCLVDYGANCELEWLVTREEESTVLGDLLPKLLVSLEPALDSCLVVRILKIDATLVVL
jgi:hypothetical protein